MLNVKEESGWRVSWMLKVFGVKIVESDVKEESGRRLVE